MTNNQTKCGIIYEKITMREGDDERMINYELHYELFWEKLLTNLLTYWQG